MIRRKVLEKIATFTTHPDFVEDDDSNASAAESVDPDMILTTGSDADSSGGSKVVSHSVDGEDGLVDVTMKEANGIQEATERDAGASKPSEAEKSP
jgi:ubiquitin carboxyl-terminal hydrolase 4/11/15